MTAIRRCLAIGGAALFLGAPAIGCGTAATDVLPASGHESSSDALVELPHEPIPSETPEPGPVPQKPNLVEDDRAPVAPDVARLAEMFVAYAVGESDTFPHWESVSMSLGGRLVVSIDDIAAALSQRRIWKICPADWNVYGASSCPVDLLGPIANAIVNDIPLVYSALYGDVTCAPARTGPLPTGRLAVLRPELAWRTCANDFALVLAADGQGRLRDIDLTLSEP